ncbi:hypothetical protein AKJ52_00475 [candidate division MSBL1 archaeon SCGC-AAA382C18]|uniref:Uncharacterized protein n=1 Tax=candidate division MSBL1 archaeon SCGC-AAA382C18 TaxID=1698281 RepID=A0A133VLN4_9EURY|nr:hypothetical protein AKJ52_00475 [candidate division MSBL1 archaeon SCGC-AAA382C18]
MGYVLGLFKYIIKGPFTNPVAFYIFGGALMAIISAIPQLLHGNFIQMSITYFMTKYLPPTSLKQIIEQILLGTSIAGIKWFLFTPRI